MPLTLGQLTDLYFDAEFYGDVKADDAGWRRKPSIDGAQGVLFACPCGQGMVQVPFANPRNAPACPPDHGPWNREHTARPRWSMSGTGLHDLTITPSVDVGGKGVSCWHGWITNGKVS